MKKRGELQTLSIGMIFSILLIIAIVSISFYAITKFLEIKRCTETGLFYDEFQDKIDSIWTSSSAKTTFVISVPGGVSHICFGGGAVSSVDSDFAEQYKALSRYFRNDANIFIYPPNKACEIPSKRMEHLDISELGGFECFEAEEGRVSIGLEKEVSDAQVRVIK